MKVLIQLVWAKEWKSKLNALSKLRVRFVISLLSVIKRELALKQFGQF